MCLLSFAFSSSSLPPPPALQLVSQTLHFRTLVAQLLLYQGLHASFQLQLVQLLPGFKKNLHEIY